MRSQQIFRLSLVAALVVQSTSCTQQQIDSAGFSGTLPVLAGAAGAVVGHQSGRTAEGALVGAGLGLLLQESIKSNYYQRQYAQQRAERAMRSSSFQKSYASKRSKTVKKVAVKVPADRSDPQTKEGYMIYDPDRRTFDSEKVYPSTTGSTGDVVKLGGTNAVIYGY
ncbi:MAG: hypothetical protein EOP06_07155 [Proteobacteria bacterium]|nr:MAG: hypothetical protein EOP06_07155 [Pseudomonadota bacterium]